MVVGKKKSNFPNKKKTLGLSSASVIYAVCVAGAVCWNRKLNRQLNAACRKPVKAQATGGTAERRVKITRAGKKSSSATKGCVGLRKGKKGKKKSSIPGASACARLEETKGVGGGAAVRRRVADAGRHTPNARATLIVPRRLAGNASKHTGSGEGRKWVIFCLSVFLKLKRPGGWETPTTLTRQRDFTVLRRRNAVVGGLTCPRSKRHAAAAAERRFAHTVTRFVSARLRASAGRQRTHNGRGANVYETKYPRTRRTGLSRVNVSRPVEKNAPVGTRSPHRFCRPERDGGGMYDGRRWCGEKKTRKFIGGKKNRDGVKVERREKKTLKFRKFGRDHAHARAYTKHDGHVH